jgi:hypothetical protein
LAFRNRSLQKLVHRYGFPADARAIVMLRMVLALVGCADDPLSVVEPRMLEVVLADGRPLPAVHMCPTPFGEGSEAWVAFGSGTLTLHSNGEFAWRFNVGSGFSYHGPAGVKQGHGWIREARGTYRVDADRTLALSEGRSSDGPVSGTSGRLTAAGAELGSVALSCPHSPPGTPPHTFWLVLRLAPATAGRREAQAAEPGGGTLECCPSTHRVPVRVSRSFASNRRCGGPRARAPGCVEYELCIRKRPSCRYRQVNPRRGPRRWHARKVS